MKIISHRGGAKLAAENSIEAIRVSKSLGVDAAEIDVRLSKDNILVVFHDKNLKRMSGVNKNISSLNLNEIKSIRLKNGQYIPTLEELIDFADTLPLVIEGKGDGWAKQLSLTIKKYPFNKSMSVISFNASELSNFKEFMPSVDCYLVSIRTLKALKLAKVYKFQGIDIHFIGLNPYTYLKAKKSGLKIILFTINNGLVMKFVKKYYQNIDITTDRPDKFVNLVKNITP